MYISIYNIIERIVMKDKIKIVLIGAGSRTFASCVINDIVSNPDLAAVKVDVWLVDIKIGRAHV